MDFVAWMHETHSLANQTFQDALRAAAAGDTGACVSAARQAARTYLRRYLQVVGDESGAASGSVAELLRTAASHDSYFERLRPEAALLDAGADRAAEAGDLAEAVKEIRFLVLGRAGKACGFEVLPDEPDPTLSQLLMHATPIERACSIFAEDALLSFNEGKQRGLISGEPLGVVHLHDPVRCTDFVMFGFAENKYYAGEKVAHSHRIGVIDEAMEEDYQPSVRLFFLKRVVEQLRGFDDDGMHSFMVRDRVSLNHLVCAAFPSEQARDEALARVRDKERRQRLAGLCLTAPPECCSTPQDYVRATNGLVADFVSGG